MGVSYASVLSVSTGSLLRLTRRLPFCASDQPIGVTYHLLFGLARRLAAMLAQSLGLNPGFRGEKRVKASPYVQHTCFRGQQGISPLAPKFHQMSSHPAWVLSDFATHDPSSSPRATGGHCLGCPGTSGRLPMMPMPPEAALCTSALPGCAIPRAPRLCSLQRLVAPTLTLLCPVRYATDCSDRFTPS
jgi:hypothetical protein